MKKTCFFWRSDFIYLNNKNKVALKGNTMTTDLDYIDTFCFIECKSKKDFEREVESIRSLGYTIYDALVEEKFKLARICRDYFNQSLSVL